MTLNHTQPPLTFEEWWAVFVALPEVESSERVYLENGFAKRFFEQAFAAGVASQQGQRDEILLQLADALHEVADLKNARHVTDEEWERIAGYAQLRFRYEAVVEAARALMNGLVSVHTDDYTDITVEAISIGDGVKLRDALAALESNVIEVRRRPAGERSDLLDSPQ